MGYKEEIKDIMEERYSVMVVGSGQCGGRITATFDKKPKFLKSRREDLYPITCFVFDTDQEIKSDLRERWNFTSDNILILPSPTEDDIINAIFKRENKTREEGRVTDLQLKLKRAGIGGLPFLGRISAEKSFIEHEEETWKSVSTRLKPSKVLLTINSLTGGTGTGFSPFVIDFFQKGVSELRYILNLSVIPEDRDELYPNSIVSALYHLLKADAADGIILVDNGKMREFNCKNFYEYNSKIHEMLSHILLSPMGRYAAAGFGSSIDPADLKNWTRKHLGFGGSDICALGFSSTKISIFHYLRDRKKFLQRLADKAIKSTTIDCEPETSKSAVAVLSAPPKFYRKFLRNDAGYYDWLVEYLRRKLSRRLKLSFLEFEDMKDIYLSILMSGVYSPIIKGICAEAGFKMTEEESFRDKLLKFSEEEIDKAVKEEIKKGIEERMKGS